MIIQNRYDDLDNLISSIEVLETEIREEDILEDIREIKYRYQEEKENLGIQISEEQEREEKEMNYQFERSVI